MVWMTERTSLKGFVTQVMILDSLQGGGGGEQIENAHYHTDVFTE